MRHLRHGDQPTHARLGTGTQAGAHNKAYQHASLALKAAKDALLENGVANVSIHCRQRVIQQVHVRVVVHSTCHGHTLPLTAAQVDATLACRRCVSTHNTHTRTRQPTHRFQWRHLRATCECRSAWNTL